MSFIAGYIAGLEEADIKLKSKAITKNGKYTATDDDCDGYSEVDVAVPGGFDLFNVIMQFETLTTLDVDKRFSLEIKIGDLSNYNKSQYGYELRFDGSKYVMYHNNIYKTIFVVVYDGVKPVAIIEGGQQIVVYSRIFDPNYVFDIYEITSLSLNSVSRNSANLSLKLDITYKETDLDDGFYPKTGKTTREYNINLTNCFTASNDHNNCYTNLTLEEVAEFFVAFFNTLYSN